MDLQMLQQAQANAPPQANALLPTPLPPGVTPPPLALMQPLQVQQMPPMLLPAGQILFPMDGILLLIQTPVLLGIFVPAPPPQALDAHAAADSCTSSARGASRSDAAS